MRLPDLMHSDLPFHNVFKTAFLHRCRFRDPAVYAVPYDDLSSGSRKSTAVSPKKGSCQVQDLIYERHKGQNQRFALFHSTLRAFSYPRTKRTVFTVRFVVHAHF